EGWHSFGTPESRGGVPRKLSRCTGGAQAMIGPVRSRLLWIQLFCASLIVAGFCSPAWAADYTASSCSASAIQSLIDNPSVVDGDRIIVPAGTCTWTSPDNITLGFKAVTVQGAGPLVTKGANGQVNININVSGSPQRAVGMGWSTNSTKRQRLSNITFTTPNSA